MHIFVIEFPSHEVEFGANFSGREVKTSSSENRWPESLPDVVWAPLASGVLL